MGFEFDKALADRFVNLAQDTLGLATEDVDATQVARDIRVQLRLLRGPYWRGDVQAITCVFRAINALTEEAAFGMRRRRATFSRAPCVLLIESLLRRCEF
jgi:hypothetical protein